MFECKEDEHESSVPSRPRFSKNKGNQTRQNVPYVPSSLRTKRVFMTFGSNEEERTEAGRGLDNLESPSGVICTLCRRKFRDPSRLLNHEKRSRLHASNLERRA